MEGWKFKNDKGDPNSIEAYVTFEYDLSQYNGKNVMITISVHNGESNGDETLFSNHIYKVLLVLHGYLFS